MNRFFPAGAATKRRLLTLFALWMGCTFSGAAQAETPVIPNYRIGDAIKDAQQPRRPPPREAPEPEIVEQETRPLTLPKGETLMVREFRLEGAEFIPEAELQAELDPYKGRALSMAEIQEAAARLTALYRSRGYLVARAYVPRQDATSGVLTIRIIVGKYGKFTLDNKSLVNDGLLLGAFASLQGESAVSRDEIERAMLLIDDMPGGAMPKLTIARGEAAGTSDFGIEVPTDQRVQGYLLGDNLGSRYTGEYRLSAGASLNSPLGIADQLTVGGMVSEDTGLINGRAAYSLPLMNNGLRADIAAAVTTYELGSIYADLDATGEAYYFDAALRYPLLRSREQSLYLSFGLSEKLLRDKIGAADLATSREAKTGNLGVRHERWGSLFGLGIYSTATVGFTYGNLDFSNAEQEALNRAGANTAGDYARLNVDLLASLSLAPSCQLNTTVSLQKALLDKNLDAVEQMNLTCSSCGGVKAYRETVTGDNGYLIGVELRYALPDWGDIRHTAGVFADTGAVNLENGSYALENSIQLSDVGFGYYVGWGPFNGMVQYAHGVGPRPHAVASEDDNRVLAQVGLAY
jgi:hemolysin activation/secretion protein